MKLISTIFSLLLLCGVAFSQVELLGDGDFETNYNLTWTVGHCGSDSRGDQWWGMYNCGDGSSEARIIRWVDNIAFRRHIYKNVQMPFDGSVTVSGYVTGKTAPTLAEVQILTGSDPLTPSCAGSWTVITNATCPEGGTATPSFSTQISDLSAGDYIMLALQCNFPGGSDDPHFVDFDHWMIVAQEAPPPASVGSFWEIFR